MFPLCMSSNFMDTYNKWVTSKNYLSQRSEFCIVKNGCIDFIIHASDFLIRTDIFPLKLQPSFPAHNMRPCMEYAFRLLRQVLSLLLLNCCLFFFYSSSFYSSCQCFIRFALFPRCPSFHFLFAGQTSRGSVILQFLPLLPQIHRVAIASYPWFIYLASNFRLLWIQVQTGQFISV